MRSAQRQRDPDAASAPGLSFLPSPASDPILPNTFPMLSCRLKFGFREAVRHSLEHLQFAHCSIFNFLMKLLGGSEF